MLLPPLPPISRRMRQNVFRYLATDRSLATSTKGVADAQTQTHHIKRLAFFGDAILGMYVAKVLYTGYPDHGPGPYTQQRSRLVSNRQLAKWAREYELIPQSSRKLDVSKDAPSISQLVHADASIFEAYIAAVYHHGGEKALECWLAKLVKPGILLGKNPDKNPRPAIISPSAPPKTPAPGLHTTSTTYLNVLNNHYYRTISVLPFWEFEFVEDGSNCLWVARVHDPISGMLLASGRAKKKRTAKWDAAEKAFNIVNDMGKVS